MNHNMQTIITIIDVLGLGINALPANPSNAAVTRLIDQHIANLSPRLRLARNALAPVTKIPPEILLHIFRLLCQPYDPNNALINALWREFCLVLHVCHRWRVIAQNSASLWNRPIFTDPPGESSVWILREMFGRAKTASLSIRIPSSYYNMADSTRAQVIGVLDMFLRPKRVEELHLGAPFDVSRFLGNGISHSVAPNLRSFIISSPVQRPAIMGVVPLLLHRPSLRVLGSHLPRLRILDLSECRIPWELMDRHVWHGLVVLRLRYVSTPPRKQFYDFLAKTPDIEILNLYACLPAVLPSEYDIRNVVLSKLVICVVEGSSRMECLDFRESIRYPHTAFTVFPV